MRSKQEIRIISEISYRNTIKSFAISATLTNLVIPFSIAVVSVIIFLLFQAQGIYGGDSGDLVTAAVTMGVPHPPGYPLYSFIGWLVSHIPLFTPSWRVTLISSMAQALTLVFVYLTTKLLTRSIMAGIFASFLLGSNYLFFLYSVTPEVFGLFDLFVSVLLYLIIRIHIDGHLRYVYISAFVFGLSLTHHHVILFFVPGALFLMWKFYQKQLRNKKYHYTVLIKCIAVFLVGLLPYGYVFLAVNSNSMINWSHASNIDGLIRLITRADYGTFVSSPLYGAHLAFRFLQVKAYAQFLMIDFTIIGILLALGGLYWIYKKDRALWLGIVIMLVCIGPIFYFYASFPFYNRFTIGTYERFLLPSYIVLSVCIGCGLVWLRSLLTLLFRQNKKLLSTIPLFQLTIFLLPLLFSFITLWRFWGLPMDRTAENLGKDILESADNNSIVILGADTPLFTSQYVRYALGFRPDIKVIHFSQLDKPSYMSTIKNKFPDITIPESVPDTESSIPAFIRANRDHFPIYINTKLYVDAGWYWVPQGLLFKFVPEKDLPGPEQLHDINSHLWSRFHNPADGILSRYTHLMLSEVLGVYAESYFELGKTYLRANSAQYAKDEFEKAAKLDVDAQKEDIYTYLGLSQLFLKQCDAAIESFKKVRDIAVKPSNELLYYEATSYHDCGIDEAKAKSLFEEYEKRKKQEETSLESL